MSRRRHRRTNRLRGICLPPRRFCRGPPPIRARPLPSLAGAPVACSGPARTGLRVGWRRVVRKVPRLP
eukprot:8435873-Lingulodinium_polyedra.AAC.1